jgi:hypothetical protein
MLKELIAQFKLRDSGIGSYGGGTGYVAPPRMKVVSPTFEGSDFGSAGTGTETSSGFALSGGDTTGKY